MDSFAQAGTGLSTATFVPWSGAILRMAAGKLCAGKKRARIDLRALVFRRLTTRSSWTRILLFRRARATGEHEAALSEAHKIHLVKTHRHHPQARNLGGHLRLHARLI